MIAMISQRPEPILKGLTQAAYHSARQSAFQSTRRRLSTRTLNPIPHSSTDVRPSTCSALYGSTKKSKGTRNSFATNSIQNTERRQIAVIGAGVTGLTAAHYLARHAHDAHITIYDADSSPGGWIKADRVEVEDGQGGKGHVLFHRGPRMLRSGRTSLKYDDLVLYDVLANLKMADDVRRPHSVSNSRYLYYPDHLVKLPGQEIHLRDFFGLVKSYLTEPLWTGSIRAARNFRRNLDRTRGAGKDDESVAEFLIRLSQEPKIVDNIVSGMLHGIYGGDVYKLSAKHTLFETMWNRYKYPFVPKQAGGKATYSDWTHEDEWYLLNDMLSGPNEAEIIRLAESAINWELLAFEDGLVSLIRGLVKDLEANPNVTFKLGEPVTSLEHRDRKVLVTSPESGGPTKYDHAICTLFSKDLARIAKPADSLPSLAETHAVTIMVVNLWYPNPELLYQRTDGGFGYLIPQSTPNNDECVLGVLFDSDLRTSDDEMAGTKLTVMLGGHYWDNWEYLPTEEMAIEMAKEAVRRQLGIPEEEKVVASARLCRECLPQHTVGHRERMKEAHDELMAAFKGRLTVAGPSYTSVGVIPSMRAGFNAGMRVARGHGQPWFRIEDRETTDKKSSGVDWWEGAQHESPNHEITDVVGASGLERFTREESYHFMAVPRGRLPFRTFTGPDSRFRSTEGDSVFIEEASARIASIRYQEKDKKG